MRHKVFLHQLSENEQAFKFLCYDFVEYSIEH